MGNSNSQDPMQDFVILYEHPESNYQLLQSKAEGKKYVSGLYQVNVQNKLRFVNEIKWWLGYTSKYFVKPLRVLEKNRWNACSDSKQMINIIYSLPQYDLSERLNQKKRKNEPFSLPQLSSIAFSVLKALTELERVGKSHGFIRTKNIKCSEGTVKLISPVLCKGHNNNQSHLLESFQFKDKHVYPEPSLIYQKRTSVFVDYMMKDRKAIRQDVFSGGMCLIELGLLRHLDNLYNKILQFDYVELLNAKVQFGRRYKQLSSLLNEMLQLQQNQPSLLLDKHFNSKGQLKTSQISLEAKDIHLHGSFFQPKISLVSQHNQSLKKQTNFIPSKPPTSFNMTQSTPLYNKMPVQPQALIEIQRPKIQRIQIVPVNYNRPVEAHIKKVIPLETIPQINLSKSSIVHSAQPQLLKSVATRVPFQQSAAIQQPLKRQYQYSSVSLRPIINRNEYRSVDISKPVESYQKLPSLQLNQISHSSSKSNCRIREDSVVLSAHQMSLNSYRREEFQILHLRVSAPARVDQRDCLMNGVPSITYMKTTAEDNYLQESNRLVSQPEESLLSQCYDAEQENDPLYNSSSLMDNYEGQTLNGMRHGLGKFRYSNGDYYEGEWYQNNIQGNGQLYFSNRKLAYDGYWQNNKFNGPGLLNNYKPVFFQSKFDYSDFTVVDNFWTYYQGDFVEGSRHGKGKLHFTNGEYFQGRFENDLPNGQGSFFTLDGQKITGEWVEGIKVN